MNAPKRTQGGTVICSPLSRVAPSQGGRSGSGGYWPIMEFTRSIQGAASKHGAVAVLVGYFDESGISKQDPLVLVAGAVADSVIWSRLELPWKEHLGTTRVDWFHAVDCEHGEGEFKHIDRPFRQSLVYALSRELGSLRPQCFGSGLFRDDWQFVADIVRRRTGDDPFYFCFELCLQQISEWSRTYADGEPVALVFAQHQKYRNRAEQLHSYYQRYQSANEHRITGIGSITFADPRRVIPLQAADLVAYEIYRNRVDSKAETDLPMRPSLKNLEKSGTSLSLILHDANSLANIGPRKND